MHPEGRIWLRLDEFARSPVVVRRQPIAGATWLHVFLVSVAGEVLRCVLALTSWIVDRVFREAWG